VPAKELDEAPVGPGEVIAGKYRVERVIGSGGMGVVVAARHLDLGQLVALKFLRAGAGAEAAERFLREARATATIRGEHVAHVIDLGRLPGGAPFIVLEYLEGRDLKQAIASDGPFPVDRAVDVVLEACEAVAEAHARGIVHRDLKPANLFLARRSGGPPIVKVLDFGIAKAFPGTGEGSLTSSSDLLGSSRYMSPEQLRSAREVTGRADLWALGVVLVELLTGKTPFERGSSVETGWAILNEPVDLRPALDAGAPPALVEVIDRCLAKDPDQRTASVAELARALAPFGSHRAVVSLERTLGWERSDDDTEAGGRPESPSEARRDVPEVAVLAGPERPRGSRRRGGVVAIAVTACLVVVGIGAAWSRGRGPAPAATVKGAASTAMVEAPRPQEAPMGAAKAEPSGAQSAEPFATVASTARPGPPQPRPVLAAPRASPLPSATAAAAAPAAPPQASDPLCPDGHCSRH
jgi:serine/threonine-protein kinase